MGLCHRFAAVLVILVAAMAAAPRAVGASVLLPPPPAAAGVDPDVRRERLCDEAADPEAAPDKVHIHCRMEYGAFGPVAADLPATTTARIAAYNLERGMDLENQIRLLRDHPDFRGLDVLLVSEADRGCSRTGFRNVTRDLARALGMNYAFGVEYIELPRESSSAVNRNDTVCEHGNAILSRRPILGLEQIRHANTANWYIAPGPGRTNREPRLGGCMALAADLDFGASTLRVYSAHFDNGGPGLPDYQAGEAREIVAHAESAPGPVAVGGDLNTLLYINDARSGAHTDPATSIFRDAGFLDAHSGVHIKKRATSGMEYGVRVIIDLLFVRNARPVSAGVCPVSTCGKLSDHMPIQSVILWD